VTTPASSVIIGMSVLTFYGVSSHGPSYSSISRTRVADALGFATPRICLTSMHFAVQSERDQMSNWGVFTVEALWRLHWSNLGIQGKEPR
jgi:hypothetical protein